MRSKYQRPSDLDEILKQINDLQESKGQIVIPGKNSPFSDRLKFKLCQQVLKFKMSKDLTNAELAKILKTNQTRISEICRCQYHLYTVDRLLDLVQILAKEDKELKAKLENGLLSL